MTGHRIFLRPPEDPPQLAIVLYAAGVPAGFPSPADDHVEGRLDLNRHLVRRPEVTAFGPGGVIPERRGWAQTGQCRRWAVRFMLLGLLHP
jgi:hypothetical protein